MVNHSSSFPNILSWEFLGFWIIPAATMFVAILLNVTYVSGFSGLPIHWLALVILYWASYRPEWQPTLLVFIAGLLYDCVSGNDLIGVTSLIGMSLHLLLRSQSHLILVLPFWAAWMVIGGMMVLWRGTEALTSGLFLGHWPSLDIWLGSAVLTLLAFPIVAIAMTPLRRIARN